MRQILNGKVISNKTKDTVTVVVSSFKKYPLYGKYIKISKKYKAHTNEQILEGANVVIESTRPLSRNKKWRVLKIISNP